MKIHIDPGILPFLAWLFTVFFFSSFFHVNVRAYVSRLKRGGRPIVVSSGTRVIRDDARIAKCTISHCATLITGN